MARRPRLQFHGALYHVMSRGNRKSMIFENDNDRRLFVTTLAETAIRYHVRVYEFCLMDNHYHVLLDTPRDNLSAAMRQLNGIFSQTCNKCHNRSGHTFEGPFHSVVVQRELYLLIAARYVVLNAVVAHLCEDAASWPWSSYRMTAGLDPAPDWLYMDWIDWAFQTDSRPQAQARYCEYVNNPSAPTLNLDFTTTVVGSKAFQKAAHEQWEMHRLGRPLPDVPRVDPPPPLEAIFASPAPFDRDHFIYEAHATHGYTLAEIGIYLNLDSSRIGKLFRRYALSRRS